jgi:hypothetical protein
MPSNANMAVPTNNENDFKLIDGTCWNPCLLIVTKSKEMIYANPINIKTSAINAVTPKFFILLTHDNGTYTNI